jgi:hypothetical protein
VPVDSQKAPTRRYRLGTGAGLGVRRREPSARGSAERDRLDGLPGHRLLQQPGGFEGGVRDRQSCLASCPRKIASTSSTIPSASSIE